MDEKEIIITEMKTEETPQAQPPKKKSDKISRTVTGLIMAGVLFLIVWLTKFSPFIFDAVIIIITAFATLEIYQALARANTKIEGKEGYKISIPALAVNLVMILPMSYFFGYGGLFMTVILAFAVNFTHFIFDDKKDFGDFSAGMFALIYPTAIMGIVFVLNHQFGMIPVLLAIGISTISDALAFWIGVLFGKKKIFPKISPKKTYAGCVGGLFGGAIGAVLIWLVFEFAKFPTHIVFAFGDIIPKTAVPFVYAAIGFVLAAFSEIGDLAASRLKRQVGIKDYGTVLGSHGGILDRIDSIIFTTICMGIIMFIISAAKGI